MSSLHNFKATLFLNTADATLVIGNNTRVYTWDDINWDAVFCRFGNSPEQIFEVEHTFVANRPNWAPVLATFGVETWRSVTDWTPIVIGCNLANTTYNTPKHGINSWINVANIYNFNIIPQLTVSPINPATSSPPGAVNYNTGYQCFGGGRYETRPSIFYCSRPELKRTVRIFLQCTDTTPGWFTTLPSNANNINLNQVIAGVHTFVFKLIH
jgi:hypothetical protein